MDFKNQRLKFIRQFRKLNYILALFYNVVLFKRTIQDIPKTESFISTTFFFTKIFVSVLLTKKLINYEARRLGKIYARIGYASSANKFKKYEKK